MPSPPFPAVGRNTSHRRSAASATFVLLALASTGSAWANTLQVTSLADSGAGSLRQAIADAASGDSIAFAPGLTGTVYLDSTLTVNKSLQVVGGPGVALDGRDSVRVLTLTGGNLTLDSLVLQHGAAADGGGIYSAGTLTLNDCAVRSNHASARGGGVFIATGSYAITASDISDNTAGSEGGGLMDIGSAPSRIDSSTFAGNIAGAAGGGIRHVSGQPLVLTYSHITGNSVPSLGTSLGGGIASQESALTLRDSTISGNKARFAGGLYVYRLSLASTLTLERSLVTGNTADSDGGGIFVFGGSLYSINSTVSNNLAGAASGGGIDLQNTSSFTAAAALVNTTVTYNRAGTNGGGLMQISGTVSLKNSLLAGNVATSNPDLQAAFTSLGYNLVQNRGGSTGFAATDLPNGANPQLIPLGFNGGASATVALQAGSAAINAVPGASCSGITVDQRGYRRPAGNCDIGAYDSEAVAVLFADGFD